MEEWKRKIFSYDTTNYQGCIKGVLTLFDALEQKTQS